MGSYLCSSTYQQYQNEISSFKEIYKADIPPQLQLCSTGMEFLAGERQQGSELQRFDGEPESNIHEDMGKCVGNNVKRK